MWLVLKRFLILSLIGMGTFTLAQAAPSTRSASNVAQSERSTFIEEMRLASSRFSQPANLDLIDPVHIIEIEDNDVMQFENNRFRLYLNEETHIIKVYNKQTNYVWASALEEPDAGTFTGLLSSNVGFEFINLGQNFNVRQNIGIRDAETDIDLTVEDHTLIFDIYVGGFCTTRNCSRLFEEFVEGRRTLEQMIAVGFTPLNFSFQFVVELTESGLLASIPYDSIQEDEDNVQNVQLSSLIIFPALGATHMDDIPGYMVIPDGVGALIRYDDKEGRFLSPFEERFFGQNPGVRTARQPVTSEPLSMPIFGAVHGVQQNGFLAVLEEGAMSARLMAFPNGANNLPYNLIFSKFDLRQVYRQSFSSDRSGGALRVVEASRSDMTIRYDFLDGQEADYMGIARRYQAWLVEQGILSRIVPTHDVSPIHIQYLMADSRPSFIGKEIIPMSTFDDVLQMHQHFLEAGLTHQHISLLGWNQGGYSGQLPSTIRHERSLGSTRSFESLLTTLNEDAHVMLVNNYIHSSNGASRVTFRTDVAQGVDRFKMVQTCEMCVYDRLYTLFPTRTRQMALNDLEAYQRLGVSVLFESLGQTLFSTFDRSLSLREDQASLYLDILEAYDDHAQMNFAHAWAWTNMEHMFDLPLFNSQLSYYDDLVPLLPTVLSGHVNMFSRFLNFNSLGQEQLLRLIEFGIHPAFILSAERASTLVGTDLENMFATHFDAWEGTVIEQHAFIDDALRHVQGASMVSRDVLAYGIVRVQYDNGVHFILNYTAQPFTYDDVVVSPLSVVIGGQS